MGAYNDDNFYSQWDIKRGRRCNYCPRVFRSTAGKNNHVKLVHAMEIKRY